MYYKVRPVFVFDGEETPIFKKQILVGLKNVCKCDKPWLKRDRSIKQHLEELKSDSRQIDHFAMGGANANIASSNFSGETGTRPIFADLIANEPSTSSEKSIKWKYLSQQKFQ